jgi:predicted O-methyltransferase YrrM
MKKDSDADNRTTDTPVAVPAYEDLSGQSLLVRARVRVVIAVLAWRNRRAEHRLRAHAELWTHITEYSRASAVAGASYSDYWTLYEQVRRHKPVEVLELGTGISTVVLAQALIDNQRDGAPPGRVTSVEDYPQWFEIAGESMPEALRGTVDLVLARKVEGLHRIFRGVRYDRLPEREYDFVFSDGPDRYSPVTGEKLFNLDLVEVIARSERPLRAVVDNHYLTFYVLQKLLGTRNARYDVWRKLMFVGPVTRDDLRYLRRENFLPDLRLLGPTILRLRLSRIGDSRDGEDRS